MMRSFVIKVRSSRLTSGFLRGVAGRVVSFLLPGVVKNIPIVLCPVLVGFGARIGLTEPSISTEFTSSQRCAASLLMSPYVIGRVSARGKISTLGQAAG